MSWLFQSKIAKSQFYVWYLGSKEADGVRGSAVVLPIMRQLLRDSFKKAPSKATVQISSKGLKLVQTVPAMSRSGRVKMQVAKFQIAASCITFSMIGKAPFDDVVGVVMLVLNPEMNSPMHVHCYRCDSAATAQIMHANLQMLITRPEIQRSIVNLEQRLFLAGLLVPRPKLLPRSSSSSRTRPVSDGFQHPVVRARSKLSSEDNSTKALDKGKQKMPKRVVEELKSKISNTDLRATRNSLHMMDLRNDLSTTFSYGMESKPTYRMFGDTLLMKAGKTRSLDSLVDNAVSTNMRGGDDQSAHRFSRVALSKPFTSNLDQTLKPDAAWKPSVRRVSSSIRMNL